MGTETSSSETIISSTPVETNCNSVLKLQFPTLPLAVYRELAAHLMQIQGVDVELLPQQAKVFDYSQSQIGGIVIHFVEPCEPDSQALVNRILQYYGDRYVAFHPLDPEVNSTPKSDPSAEASEA